MRVNKFEGLFFLNNNIPILSGQQKVTVLSSKFTFAVLSLNRMEMFLNIHIVKNIML